MPKLPLRPDCQNETSLLNDDFIIFDFDRFSTQIGSKPVLSSTQKHDTDHSGEMKAAHRDIRNGEHQRAIRETALCPDIFTREGISSVTLNVANRIAKHIGCAVNI